MPREKFKDMKIGEEQFRINVVPADKGNWAVMMMIGGKTEDPEIFQKVQDLLLSNIQVFRGKDGVSIPVRMYDSTRRDDNGNSIPWLAPNLDIASDVDLFNQLILASTDFNFSPFFERLKREGKEAREKASTTSPPASPTV